MKLESRQALTEELDELIDLGKRLYVRLQIESGDFKYDDPPEEKWEEAEDGEYEAYLADNAKKEAEAQGAKDFTAKVKPFSGHYERFYSLATRIVKALAPERHQDFILQYRDEKRKEISVATYLISDAIVGYRHTFGNYDKSAALPRLWTQISILEAIKANLDKALNNIDTLVRADLFDSELESASYLHSRGHIRAAGAVAGVVLETHLGEVAGRYGFKSRKQNATIADFNEHLKSSGVYDLVFWRRIQSLADIRNVCDHQKGREPSSDDVDDMIRGVKRVIKEVS